ncbi:hypothetical protein COCMIDRAFT_21357 [Bipolaris oryzae ATCC 44560]|uniref:Uncharacterized protein n=1 Tax=Bipolaris oryzae ATCC 44560 TaxID=930090 RepID=W6ZN03_COCMI|nr:uncharacterized protein COCMIDRAFT_21357 [Bipolaris oryzae ATCC 44560]EUC51383.1 hypothetical protein COCMIDRAFT_21357 [Bipolaris oryzae ATCC 44560]
MGPTRRSERERAMQRPVAASTALVGRGQSVGNGNGNNGRATSVELHRKKHGNLPLAQWVRLAAPWPMGGPQVSRMTWRASVAMADSLAEGVPDVCRSLADDERIRSRRPNGPALSKDSKNTATPTGKRYSTSTTAAAATTATTPPTELHCTCTASDRLPWASSRVSGDGGCWPVRFPHAHARPCSGQLAAVAHVWYRVGCTGFPWRRSPCTRSTLHAEPLRGHPRLGSATLSGGAQRKLIVSPLHLLRYREHPSAMGLSRVELGGCFSGNALHTATWTGLVQPSIMYSSKVDIHEAAAVRRTRCRGRAACQ